MIYAGNKTIQNRYINILNYIDNRYTKNQAIFLGGKE
jgi:hypothetical protein